MAFGKNRLHEAVNNAGELLPRDAGLKNPHPGKRGNIAAAQLIIRDMGNYFAGLPVRFEYGLCMS